nr:ATP-binding protein [Candidatus Omnitrophota bacterium]
LSFVQIADTLQTAITLLKSYEFDVIILDLNLPDSHGENTILEINNHAPKIAIVVNTGAYEDALGVKTLSIGAQDFLVKGKYNGYTLNKTLYYAVERKRLEQELFALCEQIKDTQDQLVQTEKMKTVGTLASGVAHEVRNPLATILYGVTYLQDHIKSKDKNILHVFENIKEAAEKANNIIADLLDFSHINQLNKVKTNINEVIEKALSLTHHHFQSKQITVKKELSVDLPHPLIDINRMVQVFINLFINAIHVMKKGGTLTIRSLQDIKKPDVIFIEIDDEGPGIDDKNMDKIYDPFFTTQRAKGGVGLGLFVCQNIMKLHEGAISLKNRAEGGVRATLFLKVS